MRSLILAMCLAACGARNSVPPCADGSWAGWSEPDGVVWVSPDGDDAGDGSPGAPFLTVRAALQATRKTVGPIRVGLFPGTYSGEFQLKRMGGGELTVSGCSAEETTLKGTNYPKEAIATLKGPGRMTLRRVTASNGAALALIGGVNGTVEDVRVSQTRGRGISIVGADTRAALRRVVVEGTYGGPRNLEGWGIVLQQGTASLEDVTVTNVGHFGVFATDGASLSAERLAIQSTTVSIHGRHGVGLYANQLSSLSVSGCSVSDTHSSGIFVIDTPDVRISGCEIQNVLAASTNGGDGLVVRRVGNSQQPHTAILSDNAVTGAERMGIVVTGEIQANLSNNLADERNGLAENGQSIYATEGVTLSGQGANALDLDKTPVGRLYRAGEGPTSGSGASR